MLRAGRIYLVKFIPLTGGSLKDSEVVRVLFVCLGNICRSPMAEAVFRHLANQAGLSSRIDVSSAGTGGWHAGDPPHSGTVKILQKHQILVGNKKARQLHRQDFQDFDYIIAMDSENVFDIQSLFGKRVPRLMEFANPKSTVLDVPDPYYTNKFDTVYQLVYTGCEGLLRYIREKEKI
jgi:protein-tyrosine phosphatase